MKPGNTGAFLRELVGLLPQKAKDEWCELAHAEDPRGTVVVVCGFGATNRSVTAIRKRLLRDGFDVIVLAMSWNDFSDGVRGLTHMAERLRVLVQGLSRRRGPLFLVAHSAGGLVSRYFLQKLGGFALCDGLVTLGTPHRGTWVAALGFITHLILKARVLWEMLPISSFIRELNESSWADDVTLLSIRSTGDLVCPERSTKLPEAWNTGSVRTQELAGLSHFDFLLSKECYQRISEFLAEQSAKQAALCQSETKKEAQ